MAVFGKVVVFALLAFIAPIDDIPLGGVAASNIHIYETITTQEFIAGDTFFEILDPDELVYTYRLRPAKDFGAPFNSNFRLNRVALVPTDPVEACEDIKNIAEIGGSVAFIERGECSFLTKTINAEKAGAKAVIITESNTRSNEFDQYIEMIHDQSGRNASIPAGFLLGKNGRIINTTLKKLRKKHAVINIPLNLTFTPPQKINHPPW